jgi:hypothetical protein
VVNRDLFTVDQFASVVKYPAAKKGLFLPSQWRNFSELMSQVASTIIIAKIQDTTKSLSAP